MVELITNVRACHYQSKHFSNIFKTVYHNRIQAYGDHNIDLFNQNKRLSYLSYLQSFNHPALNNIILSIKTGSTEGKEWAFTPDLDKLHRCAAQLIKSYNIVQGKKKPLRKQTSNADCTNTNTNTNANTLQQ